MGTKFLGYRQATNKKKCPASRLKAYSHSDIFQWERERYFSRHDRHLVIFIFCNFLAKSLHFQSEKNGILYPFVKKAPVW